MTIDRRRRVDERMDQSGLDAGLHMQALCGLERINRISRTAAVLWSALEDLASRPDRPPLRVLDVACGGGDIALSLAKRARQAKRRVEIDGCDLSNTAVDYASKRAKTGRIEARFFVHDALGDPLPNGYDVVMNTLFLHHLDEPDAVLLLKNLGGSALELVLVDDLIRSRLGYTMAYVGCRLLSRSAIVHFDGPASVAGAFTKEEALTLAEQAGLQGATAKTHWPQRFLLRWTRPQ